MFPTILETPGKLYELISSLFAPNKFLYDDLLSENSINKFKDYIYKEYDKDVAELKHTTKTPEELLDEVGYILYECKTEVDIQSFRKYYRRNDGKVPVYKEGTKPEIHNGEELCTFNGGRLDSCYVFFAVKKNVDEIKREDFKNPKRQDEYGTSVISIQFTRDSSNTVSVKNRYNHTVANPDATFSNDLDNIIPGLSDAFIKKYNFNVSVNRNSFELKNYVRANDGKHYKFNYEKNNIYYCVDNVVIDNFVPKQYDKAKYIVMETAILNLQDKRFEYYDDHFSRITIEKLEQKVNKETGTREIIINDNIFITLDNQNRIISYINPSVEKIGNKFLEYNEVLEHIELPNVKKIGDLFLYNNNKVTSISLPKVKEVGRGFLCWNKVLNYIELPNIKKIGFRFLNNNEALTSINFPNAVVIEGGFLDGNKILNHIELPKAKIINEFFLSSNNALTSISLPNVIEIGDYFVYKSEVLKQVELPKVKRIGNCFLQENKVIRKLSLPKLSSVGMGFINHNKCLQRIEIPNIKEIGDYFLECNLLLTKIDLPNVKKIGTNFILENKTIYSINLPKVKRIGYSFLGENRRLKKLLLPCVEEIAARFLYRNNSLKLLVMPKAKYIGESFLINNTVLKNVFVGDNLHIGGAFLTRLYFSYHSLWQSLYSKVETFDSVELQKTRSIAR